MGKKHTFKEWMIAVRPWSFPASGMPVIVTLAYLFWAGHQIEWGYGIWALVNIIVFHAAGNTWSDWFDFRKKVDAGDTFGARTITSGMFTPGEIMKLSVCLLAVAVAGGIGLFLLTGWPLLWIGLGGLACALLYPFLKYVAAGDFVILSAYSILPAAGTSYAAAGEIDWSVLWIAIPVGLITVAILHINNLRDISTDRRAEISTIAMKLGGRASVFLYDFEILFPFFWVFGCALGNIFPWWTLAVFLSAFPALQNVRASIRYGKAGNEAIADLDEKTARLQLLFSLIFALSFFAAAFITPPLA